VEFLDHAGGCNLNVIIPGLFRAMMPMLTGGVAMILVFRRARNPFVRGLPAAMAIFDVRVPAYVYESLFIYVHTVQYNFVDHLVVFVAQTWIQVSHSHARATAAAS